MPAKKNTPSKKPVAKKAVAKATKAKPAAKKAAPAPATKKAPAKKTTAAKPAKKASKPAGKPAKAPAKEAPQNPVAKTKATAGKAVKKDVATKAPKIATPVVAPAKKLPENSKPIATITRSGTPETGKPAAIVFSLDDIEQLMAAKKSEPDKKNTLFTKTTKVLPTKKVPAKVEPVIEKPAEKRVLGAASLADILGFNPAEKKKTTELHDSEIPKKWKKYYNLLIELRAHVSEEISLHTASTLKHSSRDDSGDLSGYGNHQADAGTDSFDRDFALSLVSSEQDALNEIEQAIRRIKEGNYGVCEVTGKPIPAERLAAVPFTRYSVQGQTEYEKNLRRKTDRSISGGLFEDSADAPKLASGDDDDD